MVTRLIALSGRGPRYCTRASQDRSTWISRPSRHAPGGDNASSRLSTPSQYSTCLLQISAVLALVRLKWPVVPFSDLGTRPASCYVAFSCGSHTPDKAANDLLSLATSKATHRELFDSGGLLVLESRIALP